MHPATKELIEQYYDFFNRKNKNGFMALLDDNVVHDINQGTREIGKDVFSAFIDRMNHSYDEKITHLVIMINEDGSRASAEFIVEGTYLATDKGLPEAKHQHYQLPCGAFFEIRNHKIMRVTNYYNLQDWLKQVAT